MDTLLEKLQQQLAHYGLNPGEWIVEPLKGSLFRAFSDEVELIGQACPKDGWIYLTLKKT